METREIVGVVIAFLVLAGLSMAIVNGQNTATVASAFASAFAEDVKAATFQK